MGDYVDGSLIFDTKLNSDGVESGLKRLKNLATKSAAAAGTSVAAIGTAFAAVTTVALNASGELEQNMGGSKAVFEQYADDIQAKADEAYKNMGLSASNYLATANKMGALLKGPGFDMEEAADKASAAMQRAADVASIMGIDVSVAMESVAGAAKGNFTMMDNLGVAMNDTTLNAYALEIGLGKTTQQMTNQEKVALALEMFLDRTAYAAGNYAKENETLAGSLGTAKAALQNFISGAGTADDLVESLANAGEVVAKNLKELVPKLADGLSDALEQVIPMIPQFIDDNAEELARGAASIVAALANGIVDGAPILADAAVEVVVVFADKLGNALPALSPLASILEFVGNNFEVIAGSVLTATVAFKAYNAIIVLNTTTTKAYAAAKAVLIAHENAHRLTLVASSGALTLFQTAVGVLTGKVTLATAAQGLWNKVIMAHPIGAAVAAVSALVAAIVIYNSTADTAANRTKKLIKELDEMSDSYERSKKSAEETIQTETAKLNVVSKTIPRLDELANKTDRTAEEEQELKGIIDGLNEAMPDLKLAIDDETGALNMQTEAVWGAVTAYQALAKVKAAQDMLVEAETNRIKAQKIYDDNIDAWNAEIDEFESKPAYYYGIDPSGTQGLSGGRLAGNAAAAKDKAISAIAESEKDIEYWNTLLKQYEEKAYSGFADLEKKRTFGGSSGGSGSSSASGSAAKEASEARKKQAEAYKAAVEDELEAEERKYDILKRRGQVSKKDYLANVIYRAETYRGYADDVLKQDYLTADEQAEIRKEWIEKAEELETEYLEAYIEMDKAALDEQKENGAISQKEYWEKLTALRDKYFAEGSESWIAYSEEIVSLQKEEITKAYTEIAESAESSLQEIEQAQMSLANNLKGFGNTFKQITIKNAGDNGEDLTFKALNDFRKDNEALLKYQDALEKLRGRGEEILGEDFPDFFRQFSEMSIEEGTEAVNALLDATDDDFNRTLTGWQEYQRNSEEFASEFYKNDYEDLKEKTLTQLREAFEDVPDTFLENGELVAEAFGDGFINRIQSVFDDISAAIDSEMARIAPKMSVVGGIPINGNTTNYDYSQTTYQLASSSETVAQQLQAIDAAETRSKMRGK